MKVTEKYMYDRFSFNHISEFIGEGLLRIQREGEKVYFRTIGRPSTWPKKQRLIWQQGQAGDLEW